MTHLNVTASVEEALHNHQLSSSAAQFICQFLAMPGLPNWALDSLRELIEQQQWHELNERFFKIIAFGTAGMRGRTIGSISTSAEKSGNTYQHAAVGTYCINDFNIIRATLGLFAYCKHHFSDYPRPPSLVISYDSRYFSKHFCELTASTWLKLGGIVYIFNGPRSTPQLSFSVRYLRATAGVMITASHNPFHDNGYKVYLEDGAQINGSCAEDIIKSIEQVPYEATPPFLTPSIDGCFYIPENVEQAYRETCKSVLLDTQLLADKSCAPQVVYTPLHGTGSVCIMPLMKELSRSFQIVESQKAFNGAFPNLTTLDPSNPNALTVALEEAKKSQADGIIATDPDGDRMAMMLKDAQGQWQLLSGNTIAVLLAEYRLTTLMKLGRIPSKGAKLAIIKSFVTTPLLEAIANANGIRCINTHTGFKWIGGKLLRYEQQWLQHGRATQGIQIDYMRCTPEARFNNLLRYSTALLLSAEESGGFLANDAVRDKDGNAAALMAYELIAFLKREGITFSDYLHNIYRKYGYFKEALLSHTFEGSEGMASIQALMHSYRQQPPVTIAQQAVQETIDYLNEHNASDEDGEQVPKADFIRFRLANNFEVAVRPSGTEPKIKWYLFGTAPVNNGDVSAAQQSVKEQLEAIKTAIEQNIQRRLK